MSPSPLLAIAGLLAGCATAPIQDVPDNIRIPTGAQQGADTLSISTVWWSDFSDPALEDLIAESRAANFDLRAAAGRMQAAASQAKAAGAPLWPQISASSGGTRQQQVFVGFPIPGQPGPVKTKSTSFGISLDITWELDVWGRLGAGRAAAVADRQAAIATYNGAKLSLEAQTAKAWFALTEAQLQHDLAQATLENHNTSVQQIETRYRRGVRTSLDLRLMKVERANARDRLQQARQRLAVAARQIEVILGRYPSGDYKASLALPTLTRAVPPHIPAEIVARRPDLVTAERRLAASVMRVKEAKRARYPRISLTGSTGQTSDDLSNLLKGDFTVWRLVGNLVAPLFQGGRIQAGIDASKARNEEAIAVFASRVLSAYAEVENTLEAEGFLADREAALTEASEEATAARSLAEDQYRSGLRDLITMLSAQRAAHTAASQLLAVRRHRLDARVNLHLALGGDFTNRNDVLSAGIQRSNSNGAAQ
jgi:NodT family efflux transporter outer membrane factor (OMF) lipoprotein